ncbi:hypothetical protein ACA910_022199 [Epithemia clementina (nom. ined.)]
MDESDDDEQQIEFGTLAEQKDEAYRDNRFDADDDLEKGRIKFPTDKLYGRDNELKQLHELYSALLLSSNRGDETRSGSRIAFLGGCSGTGKSALVEEFVQQSIGANKNTTFIQGKFSELKAGDPFSALAQALNLYVLQLIEKSSIEELQVFKAMLEKVDIMLGSDDMIVLRDTLMPALEDLLEKVSMADETKTEPYSSAGHSMGHDLNAVALALQNFLKAITSEANPAIFFIDDLQWSDDASLKVLKSVLKDQSLKHLLFIAAYRSNEVYEQHPFSKAVNEVETSKGTAFVRRIEVVNLSPDSVAEFIADSVQSSPEEIKPIVEAIYTKTLGNIFFVKQALEELVRKNALYYDVMCFQWQFGDVSRVELENYLSDDVIMMVQSKVNTMPDPLPKALALAAYTKNSIELELLLIMLRAEGVDIESQGLCRIAEQAYDEGLILLDANRTSFKFAHDRIREAACALVPVGDERHQLLLRLSMVLMDRGSQVEDDWMLFAAALHLNSIPIRMTDPMLVTKLNLRVGKIAMGKGAFSEAVMFLRAGNERLNLLPCWKEQYDMTLDLRNNLAETEHFLGNEDNAIALTEDIINHAKSLVEKTRAQYTYILSICGKHDNNYQLSIEEGLKILELYKIRVPASPTDRQAQRSKLRLNVALCRRSLLCCSKFPMATDDFFMAQCKIAQIVSFHAFFAKRFNLGVVVANKMLRLTLAKKSITKDLPYLAVCLGAPCRQKEKYDDAIAYANIGISLLDRFPGEKTLEFLKGKLVMTSMLACLRLPFRDAIERFLDLNKALLAKGETDLGLGAGMLAMLSFYHASLPLNSLLEPKLILLEEMSLSFGRKTFVVIFSLLRQCLYNLQGGGKSSSNPTEMQGEAFHEDVVMAQFEGVPKQMNNRDIAMVRLMLAVIFDDEAAMGSLLDRLDGYPVHDPPLARQHFRMTYTGFASIIMANKYGKHETWADTSYHFFEKQARFGSPNAQPAFSCLKALRKPSVAAFDEAISVCGNAGLQNFTALMNERCGVMLLEESKANGHAGKHVDYLKHALWLYDGWGATAKVSQLQSRFEFLQNAIKEKPPSQLSSVRRKAAMLGVHHNAQPDVGVLVDI